MTVLKNQQQVADEIAAKRAQVGPEPTPEQLRFKGEFSAELIQAALVFARKKANEFATEALGSAQDLAKKLDLPNGAGHPPLPDITAELDAVIDAIDLFSSAVEKGVRRPSVDLANIAVKPLANVIAALEKAVIALFDNIAGNVDDKLKKLLTGVFSTSMPDSDLLKQFGLAAGPGGVKVASGKLSYTIAKDNPNIVGVHADSVELAAVTQYRDGNPSFGLTLRVTGLRITLPAVGNLLAELGIAKGGIAADLVVTVDTVGGLTIGGATNGRIALPARKQIGPLKVKGLALDIHRDGPRLLLDLVALAEGNLGPPIRLTVDGAGLTFVVDPNQKLPVQKPTVKLPTGFGVAINAGPVRGDGYVAITPVPGHPDWTRYGGMLALRIGPVDVK